MAVKLRCPHCHDSFPWVTKKKFPNHCPLCGGYVGMGDKPEVAAPLISKPKHAAADISYRELENSTAARAAEAADMLGVSASEMSHMKITDMAGSIRQGDMSVKEVQNSVTEAMASSPVKTGFDATMDERTVQHIQAARAGAGAGKAAHQMVTDHFQKHGRQIVSAGTTARH